MTKPIFTKPDGKKYAVDAFRIVELSEGHDPAQTFMTIDLRGGKEDGPGLKTVCVQHGIEEIVNTLSKMESF